MTARTTTSKATGTRKADSHPVVPAPRRSPEQSPQESPEPDDTAGYPLYPLVQYALDHATALRPRQD